MVKKKIQELFFEQIGKIEAGYQPEFHWMPFDKYEELSTKDVIAMFQAIIKYLNQQPTRRVNNEDFVIESNKSECTPHTCPFAEGAVWGMSPEGLEVMRKTHEKYHEPTRRSR